VTKRPVIAITMGDPAGIGPEVTAKALARAEVWECCRPLVIGDAMVLRRAAELVGGPPEQRPVKDLAEAEFDPRAPDVLDLANVDAGELRPGQVAAHTGRASVAYVEKAVELALQGGVAAVATGPINKAALHEGGIPYVGHTELLAALTGEERLTTMLATPGLRVVHVTRHLALSEVASHITRDSVVETIRLTARALQGIGLEKPRLAAAALNPHGSDGGLMGREEIEAIGPAVELARAEGIDIEGPIPADSVFLRAVRGEFDVVVAMYHDQGHIPIKMHDFERSVTVTLGLPIIRTSVDHGTAFEIAWQGVASEESTVEAIKLAAALACGGGFAP
jgi:4-hydroxythreonine-4-phosphate dehydrogenase